MITTLKLRAYLDPLLLIFAPIIFWIMKIYKSYDNQLFTLLSSLLVCWGYLVFIVFSYYKEYSIDGKNLMIRNLIGGEQITIPLISITSLKIKKIYSKAGYYHNIIVETKNGEYTLKGLYISEMIQFFYELEKTIKRIS